MGIIFYISKGSLKLIGLCRELHLQESYVTVLHYKRCNSQAGLVLKKSKEKALRAVSTDFISECLCFCMAPKAGDPAASLVLHVC